MRICSFLPSATEIIAELGLVDSLVGVSEECRWPPEVVGKPVVTAAKIDPSRMSSLEIDEAVRASVRDGRSLYAVDADLIAALAPDLVVTQDLCAVCAVSSGDLESACPVEVDVLALDPRTLGEVAESVRVLARRLGAPERGDALAARMLEEIEVAGGEDVLGRAGEPSRTTSWDEVLVLEPELVIVGPCGFGVEEAATRAADLELPCPAVAVDGDAYYSRPAPRLAAGGQQLAHLIHPDRAPDPGLPAVLLSDNPKATLSS